MKVRYTRTALRELSEIFDYIARDNPAAAEKVGRAIASAIRMVARHPKMAPMIPGRDIRAKLVVPYQYRIFFTVAEDEIVIRNVRSTRRRLPWE